MKPISPTWPIKIWALSPRPDAPVLQTRRAELVALAHKHGYQVIPLVGPSSILLALVASGANGQNFSFNGYLPISKPERIKTLKTYEKQSAVGEPDTIIYRDPLSERAIIRGYDSYPVSHHTPHNSL